MTALAFTGTERGCTQPQSDAIRDILIHCSFAPAPLTFHHGDCQGADAEAAELAYSYGFTVVSHPPTQSRKRGYAPSHSTHPPLPYLERNRALVDAADLLIAAPRTVLHARCRDGFCATVRYAQSLSKPVIVVYPDGLTRRIT